MDCDAGVVRNVARLTFRPVEAGEERRNGGEKLTFCLTFGYPCKVNGV